MVVQLRPLTLIVFVIGAIALGAAVAAWWSAQRISRLQAANEMYVNLANSSLNMSARAFTFAEGYQETMETCMKRFYAKPAALSHSGVRKGGLGGPQAVRGKDRLP